VDEVETADAVTDFGFAGCAHAKKSSVRQVLLLDKETLDAMDLRPGRVRENITTEGIDREWPGIGRTPAHRSGAAASERGLHAMRSTG
jgi:hypothetical protein